MTETPYFMREAVSLITGTSPLAKCSIVKVLCGIVTLIRYHRSNVPAIRSEPHV